MASTTPIFGLPYQESDDPPDGAAVGQDLAEATETVLAGLDGRLDTAEADINTAEADIAAIETDIANMDTESSAAQSATAIAPLVSSAGVDTAVITKSYAFKDEYAYRISYTFRVQFAGGTSPFILNHKIKRANASGTTLHDGGGTAAVTTNFINIDGWCIVKCTAGNTTQTIVVTAAFGGSGSPTSIDVEAASTNRSTLLIERIGPAASFPDALEVPTA